MQVPSRTGMRRRQERQDQNSWRQDWWNMHAPRSRWCVRELATLNWSQVNVKPEHIKRHGQIDTGQALTESDHMTIAFRDPTGLPSKAVHKTRNLTHTRLFHVATSVWCRHKNKKPRNCQRIWLCQSCVLLRGRFKNLPSAKSQLQTPDRLPIRITSWWGPTAQTVKQIGLGPRLDAQGNAIEHKKRFTSPADQLKQKVSFLSTRCISEHNMNK